MRIIATGLIAVIVLGLGASRAWREAGLFTVALALGAVLWLTSFSFAGAWRRVMRERRTAGTRAQVLLIGLSVALFLPAISAGTVLGGPVRGFIFSVGPALVVGAFLFGVGMQLGAGCGSGTLCTAGGGSASAWITLLGFVLGATCAAWGAGWWSAWPQWRPVALTHSLGLGGAVAGSILILVVVFHGLARWERAAHGSVEPLFQPGTVWSLGMGALGLAALGFITLVAAGRPWTITAAFPLWGSLLIGGSGVDDPVFWAFWEDPTRAEALLRPFWLDRTTVMDVGVILGAAVVSAFSARSIQRPHRPRTGVFAAAILGGSLMGIGAVMASGCNVSALLGGISSGGAHGWVWALAAIPGAALGIRLRRSFGLP